MYRLLEKGEEIRKGDELYSIRDEEWETMLFMLIGQSYNPSNLTAPIRRKIKSITVINLLKGG